MVTKNGERVLSATVGALAGLLLANATAPESARRDASASHQSVGATPSITAVADTERAEVRLSEVSAGPVIPDAGTSPTLVDTCALGDRAVLGTDAVVTRSIVQLRSELTNAAAEDPAMLAGHDMPDEAPANNLTEYLRGYAAALETADSRVLSELRDRITRDVCSGNVPAREEYMYVRLAQGTQELASTELYECLLERHLEGGQLAVETIYAWNRSGLPRTPAWERVRQHTQDPLVARAFERADGRPGRRYYPAE